MTSPLPCFKIWRWHTTISNDNIIENIGEYEGQGVYWGLSTASEVFLPFTTQLHKCLRNFFYSDPLPTCS